MTTDVLVNTTVLLEPHKDRELGFLPKNKIKNITHILPAVCKSHFQALPSCIFKKNICISKKQATICNHTIIKIYFEKDNFSQEET